MRDQAFSQDDFEAHVKLKTPAEPELLWLLTFSGGNQNLMQNSKESHSNHLKNDSIWKPVFGF